MRPGVLKRALVVVGCGALTVTLAACESTESESAKIDREAAAARESEPGALKLGAPNRAVRASQVTLLDTSGRKAVAVRLTSTAAREQIDVPVLVEVTGEGGKLVYSNQFGGSEAALQHIARLPSHGSAWWVNDAVLANQAVSKVRVRVGTGAAPPRSRRPAPLIGVRATRVVRKPGASSVGGVLVNRSTRRQRKVPVFAVALRGGKVVAAGRAIVAVLRRGPGASAPFQIALVGDATGAKVELTAVATGS